MSIITLAASNDEGGFGIIGIIAAAVGLVGSGYSLIRSSQVKSQKDANDADSVLQSRKLQSSIMSNSETPIIKSSIESQKEIYKEHQLSALQASTRYSNLAHWSMLLAVVLFFVATVAFIAGAITAAIAAGAVTVLNGGIAVAFGQLSKSAHAVSEKRFDQLSLTVDRSEAVDERLRIAAAISDPAVRDQALARLVVDGLPEFDRVTNLGGNKEISLTENEEQHGQFESSENNDNVSTEALHREKLGGADNE